MAVVVHRVTVQEHQILVLVQVYRILVSVLERQTRVLVCCIPVLDLADTCELAPERNLPFPVRGKVRLLDLVVEHMSEVELARELLRTLVSAVPLENRCKRVTGLEEEQEHSRADHFLVWDGVPKWQLQQPLQLFVGNQVVVGSLPVQVQSFAGSQEEPEAWVLHPEQTMLLAHRLVVLGRRSPQARVHILQGLEPCPADMQMEEDPALQHSAVEAVVLGRKEVVLLLLLDRRIRD